MTTQTAKPKWEYFCDHSYFNFWCVRREGEREFGQGYHLCNSTEAEDLAKLLNEAGA